MVIVAGCTGTTVALGSDGCALDRHGQHLRGFRYDVNGCISHRVAASTMGSRTKIVVAPV
jgi:hypothetical protein